MSWEEEAEHWEGPFVTDSGGYFHYKDNAPDLSDRLPVTGDLPDGVKSMTQWGQTMVTFGKTYQGLSYAEVIRNTKSTYWKFMVNSKQFGPASRDFAAYIMARGLLSGKDSEAPVQGPVIPGTTIPRTFKPSPST